MPVEARDVRFPGAGDTGNDKQPGMLAGLGSYCRNSMCF